VKASSCHSRSPVVVGICNLWTCHDSTVEEGKTPLCHYVRQHPLCSAHHFISNCACLEGATSGSLHNAMLPKPTHNAVNCTITITARHEAWTVSFPAPQQPASNHSFTKHHVRYTMTKSRLWDAMRSSVATTTAQYRLAAPRTCRWRRLHALHTTL
jgi:hypothetical protein